MGERARKVINAQANNPLHGVTLEAILNHLVNHLGWDELGQTIKIKCFTHQPSIKSCLTFLRKTPWARERVEALYLRSLKSGDLIISFAELPNHSRKSSLIK
ncbi:MAG: VF530 family protein [Candidatus Thiodiazotropha sp.]